MKVWCQTGAQTVYFFDRQRTGTGGLILERQALCVGFDGAGEDHDALNETPDFGDNSQCAAGENREQQLNDCLGGVAQIEVVDAEAAEEDAEQTRCHLGFIGHALIELTVCILLEGVGRSVACVLTECGSVRVSRAEGLCAGLLKAGLNLLELGLRLLELRLGLECAGLLEIRLRLLLELHAAAEIIVDRLPADLADDRIARCLGAAACAVFDSCTRCKSAFRTCNIGVEQNLCTISAKHIFVTSFVRVQTGT